MAAVKLTNYLGDALYVVAVSLSAQANKLSSPSVPGLGGCGDEPHAAQASPLQVGSSGVGKTTELSVSADDDEDDNDRIQDFLQSIIKTEPVKINFRYPLTTQTVLTWETTYVNNNLYIEVPHGCLPDASKDAFVALLEYAEEVLGCQHAIVYFSKDRDERATLIRTFMFMGFFATPPESPLVYPSDSNNVYMVYKIV